MILLWAAFFSLIWAVFIYLLPTKKAGLASYSEQNFIIPTLLFAPFLVYFFHAFFDLNLIFPVAILSSPEKIAVSSLVPSGVLCVASGLIFNITIDVRRLKLKFRESIFSKLTLALGLSVEKRLFKLVVLKALIDSWVTSLPWIFGELLIIEALFNAPGLGLDIWHMARMRDIHGFLQGIVWLLGSYFTLSSIAWICSRKLGRKLEGYN